MEKFFKYILLLILFGTNQQNCLADTTISSSVTLTPTTILNETYYWVGGTGNWNDLNHWSTTSGGSIHYSALPSATDDVIFDANSFTSTGNTVSISAAAYCKSMTWTGVLNSPTFTNSNTLSISGSLTLINSMTFNAGSLKFTSTTIGNTITSAGKSLGSINFDGVGGSWGLQDHALFYNLTLTNGAFKTNNYNMTFSDYGKLESNNSNVRSLDLGTSTITLGSVMNVAWDISNKTNLIFSGASSTIVCTGYRADCCGNYFHGGGLVYGDLLFTRAATGGTPGWYISGNNTFRNVSFAANGYLNGSQTITNLTFSPGYVYTLASGSTQTIITSISATGTCVNPITIKSSSGSATISKSSGSISLDYTTITGISATGGALFTANNAVNGGNNTGWTLNTLAPTNLNLYWIGGTGNWGDGSHWSTTSGGAAYGCLPSSTDNVIFDANSFPTTGLTVTVNLTNAYCKNMDWTGSTNSPTFTNNGTLSISGSLTLINSMTFNAGSLKFTSTTTGNTITSAGKSLGSINFDGVGGSWGLQDHALFYNLTLTNGAFKTNNYNMTFSDYGKLESNNSNVRSLDLGTSTITLGSVMNVAWDISNKTNLIFSGASSTIVCTGYRADCCGNYFHGGGLVYGDLLFTRAATGGTPGWYISGNNTFRNVSFAANGYLNGSQTITNLTFSPGYVYTLAAGSTQRIKGSISATGTSASPITIKSSSSTVATLKGSGTYCMDYLNLQYIATTGGGSFDAGTHTTSVTGSTGFIFTSSCVPIVPVYSSNADLSALAISAGTLSPVFASGTTSYTASVSNATASMTVTPTSSESNATVTINGITTTSGSASGAIALAVGSNTITTVVSADDGTTTKSYTITMTRAAGVATLSNFNNTSKKYFDASYTLTPPTSNNTTGAFTYTSSNTNVATISGNTVTLVAPGSTTITATQATDGYYMQTSINAVLTVSSAMILTKNGVNSTTNPNYINKNGGVGTNFGLSRTGAIIEAKTN